MQKSDWESVPAEVRCPGCGFVHEASVVHLQPWGKKAIRVCISSCDDCDMVIGTVGGDDSAGVRYWAKKIDRYLRRINKGRAYCEATHIHAEVLRLAD